MTNQFTETTTSIDALQVHVLSCTQFKTNTLYLKLHAPLDSDTVTKRALLAHVLESGTERFPSTKALRSELNRLYGASFNVDVSKKGDQHVITYRIDIANEKFLGANENLLEAAVTMLSDALLRPAKDGELFKEANVTKEKRALKQRLDAIVDDKMRYAGVRLIEEMCEQEVFRLHPYGDRASIDNVSNDELFAYYKQFLQTEQMDLYIVGDVQADTVVPIIKNAFAFSGTRQSLPEVKEEQVVSKSDVKEVQEAQDIQQGKLNIGYRVPVAYDSEDYYALQVMNGIFGGFSHSKLFTNVREKESLAYYAASRLESHKGLLLVMSGIEFEQFDKTKAIIIQQMDDMKNGVFTDTEVEQTKAMIANQLLEMIDTPRGIVEMLYNNVIAGTKRSVEDFLQGINNVTNEAIVNVAQKAQLDTVYFLKGLEEEQHGSEKSI
ncbi:EF-P 5-aminopentanol modification-associated protein YfmF [Aureibacillus halotolerans]|uniref:Putative Zn-dependent peptidase n=1 Tax=Aureibacillus halotolerans TaxID=1508390 RepID=A0A4R6U5F3_9BACI|nr:pitrilysin family protein [Aureibacillus halotolerans]TDQ39705.1 putative Zn-dependent peptidase [Aureibacillus halotolerans]